jgi:hypothetical protein
VIRPLKLGASNAVEFSPDGRQLATIGRYVWVWDIKARSKRWRAHPFPHPSDVAFSPDGNTLAVKNTGGKITLLDSSDGSIALAFDDIGDGEGSSIVWSADGEYLVDGSWSGHLRVRQARSGDVVFHGQFPGEMLRRIHADRSRQTWFVEHGPKVRPGENFPPPAYFTKWEWPFERSTYTRLSMSFAFPSGSALSPDGSRLAIIDRESLQIRRQPDGELLASTLVDIGGTGAALRWSHDGSMLGSVQRKQIAVYQTSDLRQLHTYEMEYPSDISWSPQEGLVALGDWASGILVSAESIKAA